jgi:hypothetical protein
MKLEEREEGLGERVGGSDGGTNGWKYKQESQFRKAILLRQSKELPAYALFMLQSVCQSKERLACAFVKPVH